MNTSRMAAWRVVTCRFFHPWGNWTVTVADPYPSTQSTIFFCKTQNTHMHTKGCNPEFMGSLMNNWLPRQPRTVTRLRGYVCMREGRRHTHRLELLVVGLKVGHTLLHG